MHDHEFRREVRAWLAAERDALSCAGWAAPAASTRRSTQRLGFHRRLAAAGWTCLGWPVEHGGRGAIARASR